MINEKELKEKILSELEYVRHMDQREYILYDKWREFNSFTFDTSYLQYTDNFFESTSSHPTLSIYRNRIWVPKDPMDYLNLKPKLVLVHDPNSDEATDYSSLIKLISSFNTQGSVGRSNKYLVIDEVTGKFLGVINIASDILTLKTRDDKIGWTKENKEIDKKINNTAQGHAFLPTQPFGHNYLGGKLLALLRISDIVEGDWKRLYGDTLVGLTTTSLNGKPSQYSRLKYWKEFDDIQSSTSLNVSKNTRNEIKEYMQIKYPDEYNKIMSIPRRANQNILDFIYKQFGIDGKKYISGHVRGVFFSPFYENTYEFLRNEIKENELKNHIDNSTDSLIQIWQEYATNRIKKLVETDSVRYDVQLYDDLIGMTWEEAKEKYIK